MSCACNSPAMAKLWPSRNSTVVFALRSVSSGIVVPLTTTGLVVRDFADVRREMQIDQAGVEHGRNEIEGDPAGRKLNRNRRNGARSARLDGRNGNLGAREEARLLAGLRNDIGLRQGLDQALILQRRNQRVDPNAVRVDDLRQQRPERDCRPPAAPWKSCRWRRSVREASVFRYSWS